MPSIFNAEQQAHWQREGWVLVRGCFDAEETAILRAAIEQDPQIAGSLYDRRDAEGRATRMATWNHPGDSVYGLAARSRRVVDTMESVLGGEVYHYHSKLTAKEPLEGGAWEWHQDYGYWYHNGCPRPDMGSVMVALDHATRENGCLQVLSGSHLVGRVEHGIVPGEQVGADPQRVAWMLERLPHVHVEMAPGDALFFHANVMHRSDANRSPNRRWTVLFCFNTAANDPLIEHHHPRYTPLAKVEDSAVRAAGVRFAVGEDANFRKTFANPKALQQRFAAAATAVADAQPPPKP
ncbi:MAG: phytanoyl-CoA dioxygenase family protein [Rubrivivax sp.]|nr:phytanoyl-CoA dioxygenase family protein [Rubrivivax sp.]